MAIVVAVHDTHGDREHAMVSGALRMEFTTKIGTVVIIDLRIADVPTDIPVVAIMDPHEVQVNADWTTWTVSNADGASHTGTRNVFFLSLKDKKLLVHEG